MTNKDKYLKDGVDIAEFICGLRDYLDSHRDNYDTSNLMINYLNKPVKPTLTEDEKVILRKALESGADAIFRNDGGIYFHTKPGTKGIFGNSFQFIQQRRRI